MVSMLWYTLGAAVLLLMAFRNVRRFETNDARVASILRLAPWAVFFGWPARASELGGLAFEGAAVFTVLLAANWYAKVFLHDADRVHGEFTPKS
ncbi:MAG: hypothetical protein NVS4B5_16580 [Vulcanimicrobiaceae bacterium]